MRGSLVVVLPVADDGGQALAHQRFGDVAARQKREGGSAPAQGPHAWHHNQGKDEETPPNFRLLAKGRCLQKCVMTNGFSCCSGACTSTQQPSTCSREHPKNPCTRRFLGAAAPESAAREGTPLPFAQMTRGTGLTATRASGDHAWDSFVS